MVQVVQHTIRFGAIPMVALVQTYHFIAATTMPTTLTILLWTYATRGRGLAILWERGLVLVVTRWPLADHQLTAARGR